MTNRDTGAVWNYHDGTKHSYWSVRRGGHYLDWAVQPLPYKIYRDLEPIPLPRDLSPSAVPAPSAGSGQALKALAAAGGHLPEGDRVPDLGMLARLLYFSAGITKRIRYPGGETSFRAAACTGALYHIDLYVICGDLPGPSAGSGQALEAGVYHFGVHDFALRRLRRGDFRAAVVEAAGHETALARAPTIIACSSTYWRNAWKYQARTYRHCFWDNGTILANLLAMAASHGLPARVIAGFADASINGLLGLDTQREAALSLVALGRAPGPSPQPSPEVVPLSLETVPLSQREVDYPAIAAMQAASSLATPEEAADWAGRTPPTPLPPPSGRLFPLLPLSEEDAPADAAEAVILRRGSARRFARQAITFPQLSTMLLAASGGIPADFLDPAEATLNHLYLIVNAVDGLPSGAYVYHRDRQALELLKEGDFHDQAGYLGLEQELPADASVDVFFLADLKPILERFGNRGYRAAQLEAAIRGGKLYLAAYALGLGATGLTFYDDEVTDFFSPHARGKSGMFLTALGRPARR